jgi:ABC-type nitrate/sulfonate/bicarbonate transport system permease component
MAISGELQRHIAASLSRVIQGFLIAAVMGVGRAHWSAGSSCWRTSSIP